MNSLLQQFGDINDPSVQKVLRSLEMLEDVSVKSGEYIVREGDKSTDFYIIGLGAVEVVKRLEDEDGVHEKVLDTLGSGNFFGEGALFDNEPRAASVRAIADTRLFKIDKLKFFTLLQKNQAVGVTFLSNMLTVVNKRLRHANRELVVLYEVSKIISNVKHSFPQIAMKILDQMNGIALFQKAFFMIVNRELKSRHIVASSGYKNVEEELKIELPEFEKLPELFSAPEVRHKEMNKYFFVAVKDHSGEVNGIVAMQRKDGEFEHDSVRLCVSICEQLGSVVENAMRTESDKNKDKLGMEYVSF